MNDKAAHSSRTSRRDFLKTSTGAVVGSAIGLNLALSRTGLAQNSDTLKVGLVGCGGRGTGAAREALNADKNIVLAAMADVFPERLESSLSTLSTEVGEKVKVDPGHRFSGLDAYKRLIESDVDVVLLATPPGFRPAQFEAAVRAGKHVFCEKPMATDAPGVRSVLASAEEAKKKNLAVLAGFCWRYDYARREIFQRIHDGAVGDLRAIYSTYYTGPVKPMPRADTRKAGMTDLEWQVRNWYNFVWLSGDGLVEQAVHSVDKVAWAMKDVPPLKAVAVGGRQIPNNEGNIYDHIEVNYEYADGVRAFLGCRQITGCYNQNADYVMGSKGLATIAVGPKGLPEIKGESNWRYSGDSNNMYQTEHDEFFASIRAGKPINDGIRMCHSTLMAIMGRMAAYTGQEVTWEQALNSQENLYPQNIDWNMTLPIAPMAMPGRTKLS